MPVQELFKPAELTPVPGEARSFDFDFADPIDSLVIDYQTRAMADQLPTGAEQERLVKGVQRHDEALARDLVKSHKGLVAAVAHGFKGRGIESRELLVAGVQALVVAASSYSHDDISYFSDHAVLTVEKALATAVPEGSRLFADPAQGRPMEQVFKRMADLQPVIEREANSRQALEGFGPLEQKVLRLLTLPTHKQIAEALGPPITRERVDNAISRCFDKTETDNSTSLMLEMYTRGLHYDVPVPEGPLVEILTDEELEIGNLLELEYEEIGKIVGGKTFEQVNHVIDWMRQKTGTRSREELALVVAMFDTGERQGPDTILSRDLRKLSARLGAASLRKEQVELLLKEIPSTQAEAVVSYWLSGEDTSWEEVATQHNITPNAARNRAKRGINTMRELIAATISN